MDLNNKLIPALESQCLPVLLVGVIILKTLPNLQKNQQEFDVVKWISVNDGYTHLKQFVVLNYYKHLKQFVVLKYYHSLTNSNEA